MMKRPLSIVLLMLLVLLGMLPSCLPGPTAEPTEEPVVLCEFALECVAKAEERMDEVIAYIESYPLSSDSAEYPFVPADKRSELTDAQQALYDMMLEAAEAFGPLSFDAETDDVDAALEALLFDRPDIETYFKVENSCAEGESEPRWHDFYFLPESHYSIRTDDLDKVRDQVQAFRAVGECVASRIPEDFSVIDKYRALAYYISSTSTYCHVHGEVPPFATCAYGALIKGYSICQGYALGFEYLCRCADLDCRRVRNRFNDENMHFWDVVTLDSGTYYVDVTWSDGGTDSFRDYYWFTWFLFTAEDNHVANDGSTTTGTPLHLGN